jgi:hypothetical protein
LDDEGDAEIGGSPEDPQGDQGNPDRHGATVSGRFGAEPLGRHAGQPLAHQWGTGTEPSGA